MAKDLVDKYKQVLENDPGSLVFLELTKALLDQGRVREAIEACQNGLEYHPDSVESRVLYGKSLLSASRPAEAMEQFEKAMEIERNDPLAFLLISETLVQKKLFRSALPILKKAIALVPHDARVRLWLQQVQQTIGIPVELPPIDSVSTSGQPGTISKKTSAPSPKLAEPLKPTEFSKPTKSSELAESPELAISQETAEPPKLAESLQEPSEPSEPAEPSEPPESFQKPSKTAESQEPAESPKLAESFQEPLGPAEPSKPAESQKPGAIEEPSPAAICPNNLPQVLPATSETCVSPPTTLSTNSLLLAEIPSLPPTASTPTDISEPAIDPETAASIAQKYEQELREELLASPPLTFLQRNWLLLSIVALLLAAGSVSLYVYKTTRDRNRVYELAELRAQAFRAFTLDTPSAYRLVTDLNERIQNKEVDVHLQSISAFAHAALFHMQGKPEDRLNAQQELISLNGNKPGFTLLVYYLLANSKESKKKIEKKILNTGADKYPERWAKAEYYYWSGKIALSRNQTKKAISLFQSAVEAAPSAYPHVATLVALGNYYQSEGDYAKSREYFYLAQKASPEHLPALLGLASALLESKEYSTTEWKSIFDKARKLLTEPSSEDSAWPASYGADLDLIEARKFSLQGNTSKAIAILEKGVAQQENRRSEYFSSMGLVYQMAGNYLKAAESYRRSLNSQSDQPDPIVQEKLAHVLISIGRAKEALQLTKVTDSAYFRTRIVRGLARLEMKQYSLARAELAATKRGKTFPAEAAICLAMIDTATGKLDTARTVLAKAAKSSIKSHLFHIAMGQLLIKEGKLDQAAKEFLAAESHPLDWEGALRLGTLLMEQGEYRKAKKHLLLALLRNQNRLETRLILSKTLVHLNELSAAQLTLEAALGQSRSAELHYQLGQVFLAQKDFDSARKHAQESRRLSRKFTLSARRLEAEIDLASGNIFAALKNLRIVARRSPRDAEPWCFLGETRLRTGNKNAAKLAFRRALYIQPRNKRARIGMLAAQLNKNARKISKESEALIKDKEVRKNPTLLAQTYTIAAKARLTLGDSRSADKLARRATSIDSNLADAHLARGLALKNKNPSLAVKFFDRAIALDPYLSEARWALAEYLASHSTRWKQAIPEFEAYLRVASPCPQTRAAQKTLASLRKRAQQ